MIDLMQERWKVINPYPHSPYKVGDLAELSETGTVFHCTTTQVYNYFSHEHEDQENYFNIGKITDFPNLFEKIPWYAERSVEEFPEYVRCTKTPDQRIKDGQVLKVEWNNVMGRSGEHAIILSTGCFLPATKEEFEEYLNNKNK